MYVNIGWNPVCQYASTALNADLMISHIKHKFSINAVLKGWSIEDI